MLDHIVASTVSDARYTYRLQSLRVVRDVVGYPAKNHPMLLHVSLKRLCEVFRKGLDRSNDFRILWTFRRTLIALDPALRIHLSSEREH